MVNPQEGITRGQSIWNRPCVTSACLQGLVLVGYWGYLIGDGGFVVGGRPSEERKRKREAIIIGTRVCEVEG